MIVRAGSGWQTVLADLSLILFMVTAAVLSQSDGEVTERVSEVAHVPASPQAEPFAWYRAGPGAPPLAQWLADQSVDERQLLTIVAQYAPGGQASALAKAQALASEAQEAGARARVVVEPGAGGVSVSFAFDAPDATLARGLHSTHHTAAATAAP